MCSDRRREREKYPIDGAEDKKSHSCQSMLTKFASTLNLIKPSASSFPDCLGELFFAEIPYSCNDHLFAMHADLNANKYNDQTCATQVLFNANIT